MTARGFTGEGRDRRGFLKGAAATLLAAGSAVLLSGTARAAQPRTGRTAPPSLPLPPLGTDIACSMYAANVPLKLNVLGALTLDFKGGINMTVRSSGPDGVVFEVEGFRVEADTSPSTPDSGTLIAMTMANATQTPLSVLQPSPGGEELEMLIHLPLTLEVIDKANAETLSMLSTDPTKHATLRATDVKQFPPVNQLYTLQEPVTFYEQGGSEAQESPVLGTLYAFDVITNGAA
ncbi:twin-arginine translocation signal domain-containing protein [Streptomyces sp. NPDC096205]|uniref:twin-arginine translocation signal domain-containing protein n=1 Tax=Streptomyces sp. NPDC096205 TaxID=3366081 RepID=UPI0037FC3339